MGRVVRRMDFCVRDQDLVTVVAPPIIVEALRITVEVAVKHLTERVAEFLVIQLWVRVPKHASEPLIESCNGV
jgi:hypothetical protein